MPEVFVRTELIAKRKLVVELLLNSGGRGAELVISKGLARKLGLKPRTSGWIHFGDRKFRAEIADLRVRVKNPKTREVRESVMEAAVLPGAVLDCPLLGVVGQEKLRITPNVPLGEVIFL
jgi:hypothetical protein